MIKLKNKKRKNGFAILETLLYISFFALLSIVVINSMITMMKSFKEIKIQSELVQGSSMMEKISRSIRLSYGINTISASDLKLNTNIAGTNTAEFLFSGTNVQFLENGSLTGNLNPSSIKVSSLSFTQINTAKGIAVKVSLGVISNHDLLNRVENFYDTIILRGKY